MIQKKANFVHLGVARRRFMTRQFDFSFPFRLLASICTILSYSGKLFIYFYFARRDEIKNYYLNFYLNEIEPKPHPVPHAVRDRPPRSRPLLLLPQTQHPHPGRNRRRLAAALRRQKPRPVERLQRRLAHDALARGGRLHPGRRRRQRPVGIHRHQKAV